MSKRVKYWDIKPILSKGADYNIVFGERSNGKSYGTLEYAVEQYVNAGREIAYLRRWKEDITGRRADAVFSALVDSGAILRITQGKYSNVSYYAGRWYLSNYDQTLNKFIKAPEPFAYAFALSDMEHDKSAAYPRIGTIIFDEFLSRKSYLQDEFVIFLNVLSTIIRQRDDVKIFLLGNTVNRYCPYFEEFGLKHVADMEQGKIDVYSYGKKGLKIAVEYCGAKQQGAKPSDKYFTFDNPKLRMITHGSWELAIYPHLPDGVKIKPKEILFSFFILFNDNIIQGDVVQQAESLFLYLHRKTTPLKDKNNDLIYSLHDDPRPNHRKALLSNNTPMQARISWFFTAGKVFYQTNEIGEMVRNYMMQTNRRTIGA